MYQVNFDKWEDVQKEFETNATKPEHVYIAYYSYEDYSGTALVVYKNDGKYYVAEGSHCSCNGLEGQWSPEEYTRESFLETGKMRKFYEDNLDKLFQDVIKTIEAEK